MSTKVQMRALLAVGALSLASASWGCVADRPSRNGVFNENQYIRKDFLVRPGDSTAPDQGWFVSATITTASEPNVFGDGSYFGLAAGSSSSGALVHFDITNDKLSLLNSREITSVGATPGGGTGRQPEVINAWSATNVDLKYRVNLDGEKTNFYEENQELDWQQRQWVKVNLDKNDMSDLAPLGQYYNAAVAKCADESNASATLVTDSFIIDETNNYMQWAVQVTLPIKFDDADCMTAMGQNGISAQRLGREYQTATIQYSFMRADPNPTYQGLVLGEHDSIRRKYGVQTFAAVDTDPTTGLLAAKEYAVRYDPKAPTIDWYFEENFPPQYKNIFSNKVAMADGLAVLPAGTPTIEDATNALLGKAGVATKVAFHEWNEADAQGNPTNHVFGDIRYNMIRFIQTFSQQTSDAGVTSHVIDPRNGRIISSSIVLSNFTIADNYTARIDAYLQTVGASPGLINAWPANPIDPSDTATPPTKTLTCNANTVGAAAPILPATLVANHNGNSTLYQKMQQYMYKPATGTDPTTGNPIGPLGPQDFIAKHVDTNNPTQEDPDFFNAYFTYIPYLIYADPSLNQFVTPEGGTANTADMDTMMGGNGGTGGGGGGMSVSNAMWNMVSQETQFEALTSAIDHGNVPYAQSATGGTTAAGAFTSQLKAYAINHRNLLMSKQALRYSGADVPAAYADQVTDFSLQNVMQRDARHCIPPNSNNSNYHWESAQEWQDSLVYTYWSQVFWHEFGHAMGLEHNFMGSVDQNNFPTYTYNDPVTGTPVTRPTLYSSTVMEYGQAADRVFWGAGWGPYDQGAIGFLYTNNSADGTPSGTAAGAPAGGTATTQSGQLSPTYPWNDKFGYVLDASGNLVMDPTKNGPTEIQFLNCNELHERYTPLCREGDIGVTPSEIMANDIDNYEWQYTWRNFRQYHKFWDLSNYGDDIQTFITDQRRFMSLWTYDWSNTEIASKLQQLGLQKPASASSIQTYFNQLTNKFTDEMSAQGQLMASFHDAVIQQSSGQRPYKTTFDNFFGDTTQQGITLDKLFALQSFLALWPVDNYDPNQAQGDFAFMIAPYGLSDDVNGVSNGTTYGTVASAAAVSMLGAFDSFAYFKEVAAQQFTWDTHSINFTSQNDSIGASAATLLAAADWAGSKQFTRVEDFLQFFQDMAQQAGFKTTVGDTPIDCSKEAAAGQGESYQLCNYDPRNPRGVPAETYYSDEFNEFVGPDGRNYIWLYIQDRNQWIVADRDRNIATYNTMRQYTNEIAVGPGGGLGDGNDGNPQVYLDQVKYFSDYYQMAVNTPH